LLSHYDITVTRGARLLLSPCMFLSNFDYTTPHSVPVVATTLACAVNGKIQQEGGGFSVS